jgi:hypothetical protein
LQTKWSELSEEAKTILERVDVEGRSLDFIIGEELNIPYFKGNVTQGIVDEIVNYEKGEGYIYSKTEQNGNKVTVKFIKRCF